MKYEASSIELQKFFPEDLIITSVENNDSAVDIYLKSQSSKCFCPKCYSELTEKRGTYIRTVQDLPILGKNTVLHVNAYEYRCTNDNCEVKSAAEDFCGFLDRYRRITTRCLDFIITLALETSCEGAARVLKAMGIKTSGDTIIRILLREYDEGPKPECGSVIGVDDFASRKRFKYCTVVVDEASHVPVEVLEGRDGQALREWLKNNKHVKAVTRDRASAYAKVISEEIPDAIQIADRFHLHDNLLTAIKKALNEQVPNEIKIPRCGEEKEPSKTNETTVTQQNGEPSTDDAKKEFYR
jgi:transposase